LITTIDEKYRGKNTVDILNIFTESEFVKDHVLPDKTLFWGIRNSAINLYYRGMSIGKISKPKKGEDRLLVKVANEYLGCGKGDSSYLELSEWETKYADIKKGVENY
jgi:hypothetical protein